MRHVFLALICALPAHAQDGARATDLFMDGVALDAHLRGHVLEFYDGSKSRYAQDGRYGYTYTDDGAIWAGAYRTLDDSRVCVDFDNGSSRCDTIVLDGERTVLITADGMRFPVRNITVDGQ